MSDISFDTGAEVNLSAYKDILQRTINDVLKKIKISDDGIQWLIVEEEKFKEMDKKLNKMNGISIIDGLLPISPLFKEKCKYGRCNLKTNTIWISTAAIHTATFPIESLLPKKRKTLLVDVILDELAHIQTRKDHGDREYDAKLASFREKYYG